MLDEILKREDTKNLLKEVCYNNLYNTKETKTSIDYENYFIKENGRRKLSYSILSFAICIGLLFSISVVKR